MPFSVPARAAQAVRPSASLGLLASAAVVSTVFTATPFAIAAVASTFGVSAGMAAVISTAQVAGFTVANIAGSRRLAPTRGLLVRAAVGLVVADALSALTPWFWLLGVTRAGAGAAMGLMVWIAWADSAANGRHRGEVAAVGPLTAAVAAPVLAVAADVGGARGLYATLALVGALALLVPARVAVQRAPSEARAFARTRGVTVVLAALALFTTGGSSVFVFATVIGQDQVGLSALAVSVAFSLNAVAGIPAARLARRRRVPGGWMALTALCALAVGVTTDPVVFFVAMTLWGLAFWVAVPEVFWLLADRSAFPDQRVGDAHAALALGRIAGPTAGGLLLEAGSLTVLAVAATVAMLAAAAMVEAVATSHRWSRPDPPAAPEPVAADRNRTPG
jgi:DHA1 family inner membrane transport protein